MPPEYWTTLIEILKSTPAPILYLVGIILLARNNKKQYEDNHKEIVGLVDRYHVLSLDLVKQLTIIAEELKDADREHELPKA